MVSGSFCAQSCWLHGTGAVAVEYSSPTLTNEAIDAPPRAVPGVLCRQQTRRNFRLPLTPYFTVSSRVKTSARQSFPKYYLSIAAFKGAVNAEHISFFRFVITTKRLPASPECASSSDAAARVMARLRPATATASALG